MFFWHADTLMVSQVSTGTPFSNTVPRPLFVWGDPGSRGPPSYDVASDGQRFVIAARNPEAPAREIHVVLNWFEELKAKVGK